MINLDEWERGGNFLGFREHDVFYRYDPADHEVLLCLHGFPTASYDFKKVWGPLSRDFSMLSFDMIGYGLSAKPVDFPYTTATQVDVLQALLSHLDVKRVHILSHDYGNTIIQELLARQGEGRVDFEIETICFLNGALFPETHRPILAQKLLIGRFGFLFGRLVPNIAFAKSLASVFGPETQPTAAELTDFTELFRRNGGRNIWHILIQYMRERTVHRERWVTALQAMKQKFLLINGSDDPVSGRHLVKRFRELIPGQTNIIELPGIGHFPHFECPDIFLEKYREFQGLETA